MELDLGDKCESSFRSGDQLAEIEIGAPGREGRRFDQQIERIPGIPSLDAGPGKLLSDLFLVIGIAQQTPKGLIDTRPSS